MKRLTILSALTVMAVSTALAGCSGKQADSSGTSTPANSTGTTAAPAKSGAKDPYTFTYLRPDWGAVTYTKGSPLEDLMFQQSGVRMEITDIPVQQYEEKVNAVLGSGDLPDVLWAIGPGQQIYKDMQDQGAFLPINKYLDKYPAIKNAFPQELWDQLKDEKGNIYFIPHPLNSKKPFMVFYRKDWFDKLGIPEPKTIDDLNASLEKIKNSDPDGNGKNDTIPLTLGSPWFFNFIGTAFGAQANAWNVNPDNPNEIIPDFADPKVIDQFFWEKDLYQKGLIDPELQVSLTDPKAQDKFMNGKAAVFIGVGLDDDMKFDKALKKAGGQLGVMLPLSGPGGPGRLWQGSQYDRGLYISAKTKNPDRLFQYLNWAVTDGYDLMRWGVEGKSFYVKNGVKLPIPDDQRDKEWKVQEINPLRTIMPVAESEYNWDQIKLQHDDQGESDIYTRVKQVYDEIVKNVYTDKMQPNFFSATNKKLGDQLYTAHIKEMKDAVIINKDITRDLWMKRLDEWRKAGGDQIIKEFNDSRKQILKQ